MEGALQTAYLEQGDYTPLQTHILKAYMDRPGMYIGPVLVAGLIDLVLMGTVITSTWSYFSYHGKDALKFRLLVALLLVVSLAQSTTIFAAFLHMFAIDFGVWDQTIEHNNVLFGMILLFETLAGVLSQVYFLSRAVTLLRLWRHRAGVLFILFAAPAILVGLGFGATCSVLSFHTTFLAPSAATTFPFLKRCITGWKIATLIVDISLTATIITCLSLNTTGRQSHDTLLRSVIRWVVEAQTLPLLASISFVIACAVDPSGTFPSLPSVLEGKLATLSVLHVLLSRTRIQSLPFVQSSGNLDDLTLSVWNDTERGESRSSKPGRSGSSSSEKSSSPTRGEKTSDPETSRLAVPTARQPVRGVVGAGGTGMSKNDGLSLQGSLREDVEPSDPIDIDDKGPVS